MLKIYGMNIVLDKNQVYRNNYFFLLFACGFFLRPSLSIKLGTLITFELEVLKKIMKVVKHALNKKFHYENILFWKNKNFKDKKACLLL